MGWFEDVINNLRGGNEARNNPDIKSATAADGSVVTVTTGATAQRTGHSAIVNISRIEGTADMHVDEIYTVGAAAPSTQRTQRIADSNNNTLEYSGPEQTNAPATQALVGRATNAVADGVLTSNELSNIRAAAGETVEVPATPISGGRQNLR